MSLPNSVVRRYTPPTCTLEIAAKDSPLSRWVGQPVLKHLRFQLTFDDPRVSEDQWVKVQGDSAQLDALYDAVTTYVQQFLNQSPLLLSQNHLSENGTAGNSSAMATQAIDNHGIYSGLRVLSQPAVINPTNSAVPLAVTNFAKISLQPKGLLSHELSLGTLVNETSGSMIPLSAVQLADLATALDDYRADVRALPNLNRPSWVRPSPTWARVAAVSLIVIGVSTSLARLFEPAANTQITSPTSSKGASSTDQRVALKPFGTPSSSTAPSAAPLLVTPVPPIGAKMVSPPAPGTPPASSPIKLPTVAVPQKAPTLPDPEQGELRIQSPLEALKPEPPQIEGVPIAPLSSAESGSTRDRSAAAPAAAMQQQESAAKSPDASANATAFDTTPQVAEVRTYFQTNWKSVEGLSENLDYSLILSPDGSVQQIIPLTKIAEDFRDRITMPPQGAPFLSPIKNGSSLRIRLVLSPDGKVQTFQESASGQ